ncbi:hypothetical protein V8C86DRAFT_2520723 [Haematococcus lacustris]
MIRLHMCGTGAQLVSRSATQPTTSVVWMLPTAFLGRMRQVRHGLAGSSTTRIGMRRFRTFAATDDEVSQPSVQHEPQFTTVTYNLLSNRYIGGHRYCPPEHLEWSSRRARIQEELSEYNADIVCLQEVDWEVFTRELQPWFQQRGLQGWFQARQQAPDSSLDSSLDASSGPTAPEGVAMFIRSSMFEVLDHECIRFADPACSASLPFSSTPGSDAWHIFNQRNEGAVMVVLRHRHTRKRFLVACTHLYW